MKPIFEFPHHISQESRRILENAWKNIALDQQREEQRYLEALLGFNDLEHLFRNAAKQAHWGTRARDLVYGYWTEEDVRLRLAAEIARNHWRYAQVHGQVHISGHESWKARKHSHVHAVRTFPDLLLISFKWRQRNASREKHLETAAIEIKMYGPSWTERDLRYSITRDLDKLRKYQRRTFKPRVDSGFFFCVDESGKAGDVLADVFRLKKYRGNDKPIGYGVIVPKYSQRNMTYPRELEEFETDERTLYYLADYIKCASSDLITSKRPARDDARLDLNSKQPVVNIRFVLPEYVDKAKGRISVILYLRKGNREIGTKYHRYAWSENRNRYVKSDTAPRRLLYSIARAKLYNISAIEDVGREIVKRLRRICRVKN